MMNVVFLGENWMPPPQWRMPTSKTFEPDFYLIQNISYSGLPLPTFMKEMVDSLGEYYGDNIPWDDLRSVDFMDMVFFGDKNTIELKANMLADMQAQDIAEKKKMVDQGRRMSCRTRGNCKPLIEAPNQVQDLWAREIALISAHAVHVMDQVNIFLNGGNFTGSTIVRSSPSEREMLETIMTITEFVQQIEMYVYKMIPALLHDMTRSQDIEPVFAMYENQAICFYDGAAKNGSTFTKKFTELVSKEKYSKYIKELSGALQQLIKSDQLERALPMVYERIVDGFKQFEVNAGTSKLYRFLLEFRGYLLSIDIQEFVRHINQIYREADEGIWKLSHGEWPEMQKCMDNMIRLTIGSKQFWERLSKYVPVPF